MEVVTWHVDGIGCGVPFVTSMLLLPLVIICILKRRPAHAQSVAVICGQTQHTAHGSYVNDFQTDHPSSHDNTRERNVWFDGYTHDCDEVEGEVKHDT